ncbi:MAG: hypothetical protein ACLPHI_16150 [Terriglobales bacterium]|jgi:hypothetical protein
MRQKLSMAGMMLAAIVAMAGSGVAQTVPQSKVLMVSGQAGQAPVVQANGKSYVNIEDLAQLTNGSLSFKGNQITLTLPGSAAPAAASQPVSAGFSKDFMKAGIEAGSTIREWRTALTSLIQNGYPVTEDFVAGYRGQAMTNLRLASVAASTDSDRNAFQLLSNEFDNMQKLSTKIVAARENMTSIDINTLKDDSLYQQILTCARSLAAMASSGQFQDDGSCH